MANKKDNAILIRLSDEDKQALKKIADQTSMSMSAVIRVATKIYIGEWGKQLRIQGGKNNG